MSEDLNRDMTETKERTAQTKNYDMSEADMTKETYVGTDQYC